MPVRAGSINCYAVLIVSFLLFGALAGCVERVLVRPEYFAAEEKRLAAQIDNTSDTAVLSDLYEHRARLRVRSDNPHPDYAGALKDFEASLNLNPQRMGSGNITDWIFALSRLNKLEHDVARLKDRNEQSAQQNRVLTGTVEHLQKQTSELQKQERELRSSIEELQKLELKMEQRRQKLR